MKTKLFLAAAFAAALAFTSISDPFFTELSRRFEQYWSSLPPKIYLQPDRTWYRPGEDVWFKAWVREARSLALIPENETLFVELLDPHGTILQRRVLQIEGGSTSGDFTLLPGAAGGIYKIKAYLPAVGGEEEAFSREITVQQSVLPRLRMELEFERKAFGPGDEVVARLDLHTLDNQPMANQGIDFSLQLEGKAVFSRSARTDASGRVYPRFTLPEKITRPDGLLTVRIPYRGSFESISRAVPIELNRLDLQFLPEGGDLVAGLPGRVAFRAVNEFGKPADVAGGVYDDHGNEVATFQSYHNGMGSFLFAPRTVLGQTW